jgi:hypothetical protein
MWVRVGDGRLAVWSPYPHPADAVIALDQSDDCPGLDEHAVRQRFDPLNVALSDRPVGFGHRRPRAAEQFVPLKFGSKGRVQKSRQDGGHAND